MKTGLEIVVTESNAFGDVVLKKVVELKATGKQAKSLLQDCFDPPLFHEPNLRIDIHMHLNRFELFMGFELFHRQADKHFSAVQDFGGRQ